jgi:hypothetical protein
MSSKAKKTEHTGAKHGEGAYWDQRRTLKRKAIKLADVFLLQSSYLSLFWEGYIIYLWKNRVLGKKLV